MPLPAMQCLCLQYRLRTIKLPHVALTCYEARVDGELNDRAHRACTCCHSMMHDVYTPTTQKPIMCKPAAVHHAAGMALRRLDDEYLRRELCVLKMGERARILRERDALLK